MEITGSREERQTMLVEGHRLEIIVTEHMEDEWELCIENAHGIRTVWCEYFASASLALEAGRQAIEEEGIEEFISTKDFDYLF